MNLEILGLTQILESVEQEANAIKNQSIDGNSIELALLLAQETIFYQAIGNIKQSIAQLEILNRQFY